MNTFLVVATIVLTLLLLSTDSTPLVDKPQNIAPQANPTTCTVRRVSETSFKVEWCQASRDNKGQYAGEFNCISCGTTTSKATFSGTGWCSHTVSVPIPGEYAVTMTLPQAYTCTGSTIVGEPSKPVNLVSTDITFKGFKITWDEPQTPNGPIDGYKVTIKTTDPAGGLDETVSITERTFERDNLKPGTSYSVTVKAFNTDQQRELLSPPADITVFTPVGKPSEPLNLVSTDITLKSFKINWDEPRTPNGPIDGYKVTTKTTDPAGGLDETVSVKERTFKRDNLKPGTSYSVTVKAFNTDQQRELLGLAAKITVVTLVGDIHRPAMLMDLNVERRGPSTALVAWVPPVGVRLPATGWYNVTLYKSEFIHGVCGDVSQLVRRLRTTRTELLLSNLISHSCYHVIVSVELKRESNAIAVVRSFRTQEILPPSPSNLTLVIANSTHVSLSWSPSSPEAGRTWYNVKLIKSDQNHGNCSRVSELISSQKTYQTEISYVNLDTRPCYYVSVVAETEVGTSKNAVVTAFVIPRQILQDEHPVSENFQEII